MGGSVTALDLIINRKKPRLLLLSHGSSLLCSCSVDINSHFGCFLRSTHFVSCWWCNCCWGQGQARVTDSPKGGQTLAVIMTLAVITEMTLGDQGLRRSDWFRVPEELAFCLRWQMTSFVRTRPQFKEYCQIFFMWYHFKWSFGLSAVKEPGETWIHSLSGYVEGSQININTKALKTHMVGLASLSFKNYYAVFRKVSSETALALYLAAHEYKNLENLRNLNISFGLRSILM